MGVFGSSSSQEQLVYCERISVPSSGIAVALSATYSSAAQTWMFEGILIFLTRNEFLRMSI